MKRKQERSDLRFTTKKDNKKRKKRILVFGVIVSLVIFAMVSAFIVLELNDYDINKIIGKPEAETANVEDIKKELPNLTGAANIMVVVVSEKDELEQVSIVRADLASVQLTVYSMPLSEKTTADGKEMTLKELYAYGGTRMLKTGVGKVSGTTIDRFILLNAKGLQGLVYNIGKVTLQNPKAINHLKEGEILNVAEGEVQLTGEGLYQYMKYPGDGSAWQFENQSRGVSALANTIVTLDNLLAGTEFFEKSVNAVESDISVLDYESSMDALEVLVKSEKRKENKIANSLSDFQGNIKDTTVPTSE